MIKQHISLSTMSVLRTTGSYRGRQINLDDPISISLPRDIILPLCTHLSGEQAVTLDFGGGDWRDLADFIGLPSQIIELIDESRDGLKAYTLLKLWDRGIARNPGTLLKLIIALHESGFAGSYLQEFIVTPLQGCIDFQAIQEKIESLRSKPNGIRELFPILELTDVRWDSRLEEDVIHCSSTGSDSQDEEDSEEASCLSYPRIIRDSVFISYFSDSRSKKYKREVENIAKCLSYRGHQVWYEKPKSSLGTAKEWYIKSADTILVIFNKEYQQAQYNFIHHLRLPSCVAVDIPLLNHIFHTVREGRTKIIPVVIDRCKTQPSIYDFPVWLTSVPRILYPSESKDLVHVVQRVREYAIPNTTVVRRVTSKVIDKSEVKRKFQQRH